MTRVRTLFAIGFALLGMVAVSGCKLSSGRNSEDFINRYMNKSGEVSLGDTKDASLYTMGGASFAGPEVEELNIDWLNDSVTIEVYDGTEVVFSETSNQTLNDTTTMYYYLKEGTLNIKFGKPGTKMKGEQLPDKHLLVRVPRTLKLDNVEMNGLGQNFVMDGVRCETLEMNNVSNQITLNECEIDDIEVNCVSTDVEAIFSKMPNSIEMNNVSGSTVLYVPEDAGITLQWNGLLADFHSELPVASRGKKKVIGNGACAIESNSVSGELDIKVKRNN